MKNKFIFMTLISSFVLSVTAQTNDSTSLASGLQANKRTPEERITFLLNVAQSYFNDEDFDSAVSAYERIIEIDPKHEEARFIISHVYINAKQYRKAESLLEELIADYPDNFQLLNNLAWLYATAEDPSVRDGRKSVKIAQQALVISPNDHHVWSTLSEGYYVSGQYEKAYECITHMASIATRYGKGITKESVDSYNEQILKCKRALDTANSMAGKDEE